jgi:hypothetical protein
MNPWERVTDDVNPRRPTEKEVSGWLGSKPRKANIPPEGPDLDRVEKEVQSALQVASISKPSVSVQQQQIAYLKKSNFMNWVYLKHYFKWAQKRLAKKGWDPDQVRWLL